MTHLPSTTGPVYDHRCTADERALLDHVAVNPAPDIDIDALFELIAAKDAVIAATRAETAAETNLHRVNAQAFQLSSGSPALSYTRTARDALIAAQVARRTAVAALNELEACRE